MTPKEALKEIEEIFIHNEYGEKRGSTHDFGISLCEIIEQSLTELEELKRDVKRYFELDNKHGCTLRDIDEWLDLERKLMKVGKEE
jgi:hypothetical protein